MKRLSFNLLTIVASPVSEKLKQNSFSEYNQILKYKILSPKAARPGYKMIYPTPHSNSIKHIDELKWTNFILLALDRRRKR
ncbi:hypothetical protein [Leptospira noguchii]|uniref:hypothetical protein n=1 Tax=Leptospira noguchii TaxID=28182 RepID=UPI0018DED53C